MSVCSCVAARSADWKDPSCLTPETYKTRQHAPLPSKTQHCQCVCVGPHVGCTRSSTSTLLKCSHANWWQPGAFSALLTHLLLCFGGISLAACPGIKLQTPAKQLLEVQAKFSRVHIDSCVSKTSDGIDRRLGLIKWTGEALVVWEKCTCLSEWPCFSLCVPLCHPLSRLAADINYCQSMRVYTACVSETTTAYLWETTGLWPNTTQEVASLTQLWLALLLSNKACPCI